MSEYFISPEEERKKRKKEIFIAVLLGVLFLILTFIELRLTYLSRELPFAHSIFFFGLVNFNIVLLLFLLFLVFRNVVKTFVEQSGKVIGNSLKSKLVAAFTTFSFIPTVLMFFISVFYINSSFDKWFSIKTSAVLRDSLEVTNSYYLTAKQKNYHFANQIVQSLENKSSSFIKKNLNQYRGNFSLDIVEFYPHLFGERYISIADARIIPEVPKVSLEFLEKGISKKSDSSTMHHFEEGSLIRVIAPMEYYSESQRKKLKGAIVVSTFVPMSLISKMDDISTAYESFRDVNPLVSPIKTIYLIILCLMTLVILLGATWFGFYLAKQLSTPLSLLGEAADKVSKGQYEPVDIKSGSREISHLVSSFNHMTQSLEKSEREILEINKNLKTTLDILDEHNRYIEVILSNVSAGVISVDANHIITTLNPRAEELLKVSSSKLIGTRIQDVLKEPFLTTYNQFTSQMRKNNVRSLQKELTIPIKDQSLLMKITITLLRDENERDLGLVAVFDDLTELMSAQRAAAWREVARRIAHEIKNPLTPIKLSAQRLEKKFGEAVKDPVFQQCTEMIIKQVDDLKNLVNEFSQFARLPQISPKLGSINKTIDETLILYSTGHKEINFVFQKDTQIPEFEFDQDQMKRVLTNLLENSIEALRSEAAPKIELLTHFDEKLGIIKIQIRDNGVGIDFGVRDRIFEPYFSTRDSGTGLGLAIVKRIIEDHHGFIRAYSHIPKGTEFLIELPVVRPKKIKLDAEESVRSPFEDAQSRDQ